MKTILFALLAVTSLSVFAQEKRVIGADSRVAIRAANYQPVHLSIGLLVIRAPGTFGFCTGTVVGPRHVITAAHCLVDEGRWVDSIDFLPAMNGDFYTTVAPKGTYSASKFRVIKAYFNSDDTANDLGLLTFNRDLPTPALPLGVVPYGQKKVTIAGYPGDKIEGTLWEATGTRRTDWFGLTTQKHEVDTMPGESGAAVRARIGGVETIVGIHSAGVNTRDPHNLALFFTADHVKMIKAWMAEDK